MAVKPPMGTGKVRLVVIGEDGAVDLQPCGGTHVRATGEIGRLAVTKIEKKGKQNRRIRVVVRLSPADSTRSIKHTGERNAWPDGAQQMAGRDGLAGLAPRHARTSSSSTAPCTCRPPSATPGPSTWPSTSPAPCSSTSTTSPTRQSPLPHMLPSPVKFASRMKKMGIGDGMHIVVYDSEGLYSAARVWWMFRTMGHERGARAERRPEEMEGGGPAARGRRAAPRAAERHFTPALNAELVRDAADVKALIGSKAAQIVDARAAARFEGTRARAARRACAPATSRARATCRSPRCSTPTAR